MSKGETERIWLHLVPWLLVATAALQRRRGWLAAQLALALALQLGVRSPW
jgi:methylthioxylose transferase